MRLWHILTVRSNAEFDVGNVLEERTIEAVIPYEMKRWRLSSGTERSTRVALYRGYVFAGFRHVPNWSTIKRVDGVLGFLGMDDVPAIVPDAVIEDVKNLSAEVARVNAEMAAKQIIKAGRNARISNGAMRAHMAKVQRIIGSRAIVEIIGANRPVSIALADLEAA